MNAIDIDSLDTSIRERRSLHLVWDRSRPARPQAARLTVVRVATPVAATAPAATPQVHFRPAYDLDAYSASERTEFAL